MQQLQCLIKRIEETFQIFRIVVQRQRYADSACEAKTFEQWHCAVVPGAYGNPLFGQQVRQIGVMHAFNHKADQRQLWRAQQANALALF